MTEVDAGHIITKAPTKADEGEAIVNVDVHVKDSNNIDLNGQHVVGFDWEEDGLPFHSHTFPGAVEILVTYSDYDLMHRVVEEAVDALEGAGYDVIEPPDA